MSDQKKKVSRLPNRFMGASTQISKVSDIARDLQMGIGRSSPSSSSPSSSSPSGVSSRPGARDPFGRQPNYGEDDLHDEGATRLEEIESEATTILPNAAAALAEMLPPSSQAARESGHPRASTPELLSEQPLMRGMPDPVGTSAPALAAAGQITAAPVGSEEVRSARVRPKRARVIVMFSCRGGAGSTSLSIHTAHQLVKAGKTACLIDLDLQLGDVFVALNLEPTTSIAGLAREAASIDGVAALQRRLAKHESGIYATTQTGRIDDIDAEMVERMPQLIACLSEYFDYVIIDGVRDFGDYSLAVLDSADEVGLILTQDVSSVRRAARVITLFRQLGYSENKIKVILNRCVKSAPVAAGDVERALGCPVSVQVRNDYKRMRNAFDNGALFEDAEAKTRLVGDLRNLTHVLTGFSPDGLDGAAGNRAQGLSLLEKIASFVRNTFGKSKKSASTTKASVILAKPTALTPGASEYPPQAAANTLSPLPYPSAPQATAPTAPAAAAQATTSQQGQGSGAQVMGDPYAASPHVASPYAVNPYAAVSPYAAEPVPEAASPYATSPYACPPPAAAPPQAPPTGFPAAPQAGGSAYSFNNPVGGGSQVNPYGGSQQTDPQQRPAGYPYGKSNGNK